MTDTTTAADYQWLDERYGDLTEAYCLTLVEKLGPAALLGELAAEPQPTITGVAGLREPAYEFGDYDRLFAGVTALGDWSLMVEYNGYLGVTDEAMLPVSRGRTVVSHFRNVNAVDRFCWYRDGTVRLSFEPLFAFDRDGTHPDELLTAMAECGFDLVDTDDPEHDRPTEAAFALAHRITGVRLTPRVLETARFDCGIVPVPRR